MDKRRTKLQVQIQKVNTGNVSKKRDIVRTIDLDLTPHLVSLLVSGNEAHHATPLR